MSQSPPRRVAPSPRNGNGSPRRTPEPVRSPAASFAPRTASPRPQPAARPSPAAPAGGASAEAVASFDKPEHRILFQKYFKSSGPRTYASQIKEAGNGNHYLVLTEGKRDEETGEVRKHRLMVFSEDFSAFFHMLQETAQFIKANPVPEEVRKRRQKYWDRKAAETPEQRRTPAGPAPVAPARPMPVPARPMAAPAPQRRAVPQGRRR